MSQGVNDRATSRLIDDFASKTINATAEQKDSMAAKDHSRLAQGTDSDCVPTPLI